jgi:hypothetical protein
MPLCRLQTETNEQSAKQEEALVPKHSQQNTIIILKIFSKDYKVIYI